MKRVGELKEHTFNGKIRWEKSKSKAAVQNAIPLTAVRYICAPALIRAAHFEHCVTPVTAMSTFTREALPAREGRFHISYTHKAQNSLTTVPATCKVTVSIKAFCQLRSLICWNRRHGFHNTSQPITNTAKGEAHSLLRII